MSLLAAFFEPYRLPDPEPSHEPEVSPYTIGIAQRGRFNPTKVVTTTENNVRVDRSRHRVIGKTISLQFHWNSVILDRGGQKPIGNPIKRRATIVDSMGNRVPVTFSGQSEAVLPSGGWLISDEMELPNALPAGDYFWLETRSEVSAGEVIAVSEGDYLSASRGEGIKYGSSSSFVDGFGVFPQVITGKTVTADVQSIGLIGDSIMAGARDNFWLGTGSGGFGDRFATRVGVNWANYALGGDAARLLKTDEIREARFGDTLKYHEVILSDYGTNDWWGTENIELMQANMLSLWEWVRARMKPGAKFYTTTSTQWVKVSAPDWHITPDGQAPTHPLREPIRVAYNTWLRAGAPIKAGVAVAPGTPDAVIAGQPGHPLDGVVEMADLVETSRNSGRWKSRGRLVSDLSVETGSKTYRSETANFTASDIGVTCEILFEGSRYETTIREIISSNQAVGLWAAVGTGSAVMGIRPNDFTGDGLHPSPYAYQLIADQLKVPGLGK